MPPVLYFVLPRDLRLQISDSFTPLQTYLRVHYKRFCDINEYLVEIWLHK